MSPSVSATSASSSITKIRISPLREKWLEWIRGQLDRLCNHLDNDIGALRRPLTRQREPALGTPSRQCREEYPVRVRLSFHDDVSFRPIMDCRLA